MAASNNSNVDKLLCTQLSCTISYKAGIAQLDNCTKIREPLSLRKRSYASVRSCNARSKHCAPSTLSLSTTRPVCLESTQSFAQLLQEQEMPVPQTRNFLHPKTSPRKIAKPKHRNFTSGSTPGSSSGLRATAVKYRETQFASHVGVPFKAPTSTAMLL